jgi:hypothetical protein
MMEVFVSIHLKIVGASSIFEILYHFLNLSLSFSIA